MLWSQQKLPFELFDEELGRLDERLSLPRLRVAVFRVRDSDRLLLWKLLPLLPRLLTALISPVVVASHSKAAVKFGWRLLFSGEVERAPPRSDDVEELIALTRGSVARRLPSRLK